MDELWDEKRRREKNITKAQKEEALREEFLPSREMKKLV